MDERDSVAIKLFDNPQEQQQAMWRGLRRLLLLNIPSPIKYLHEKLPNKAKLGLYFNPYGKVLDLIDDCISCGVDKLIDEAGGPVWTEEGFSQLHDKVRAELNDTVVEIAKQVEQILTAVFNINKRLKGRVDMTMALGLSDIKAQMAGLVYRGFVTGNGFRRLGDTLRYLQAIEKRLEKMAIDPHRDRAQMLKVESVQQAWQQWLNKLPPNRREDDDVREIRWMIEELRVSFFAQQLGTRILSRTSECCRRWSKLPHSGWLSPVALRLPGLLVRRPRLSVYPRQSKAVPAFSAHGLQRRCRQPRLGAHHLNELTHALNALVGALWVDHFAVAYHVIANN